MDQLQDAALFTTHNDMEVFAPVAPAFVFDSEEDVPEPVNRTRFGLASSVFTRDMGRVCRMFEGLEYGMTGVNDVTLPLPGALRRRQGKRMGREGGCGSLQDYMDTRPAVPGCIDA